MIYKYSAVPVDDFGGGTIVVFVPQFEKVSDRLLKKIDQATSGSITSVLESGEFCGKEKESVVIHRVDGFKADRIVLVGLGNPSGMKADSYRTAAGIVSRYKALTASKKAAFYLGKVRSDDFYQAAIEGYLLGSYKILEFKTGEAGKDKNVLSEITFIGDDAKKLKAIEKAVQRGVIYAESQNMVRTLANIPGNHLTPRMLADKAQKLAKAHGLKCTVLNEKEIAREKMGALMSVAIGATEPPRFIIIEYKGAPAARKPIVLVGKGVTFDTGGISLKPGLNMHEMKSDMAGAAAVLAAVVAAARLKIPQNVVALMPATENVPSATATKPGDIVTSRKGLTIEIINTDAEGRLILADGLDYANKFKPQAVVDIATLTGAALVVLGYAGAPILGNNPQLMKAHQGGFGGDLGKSMGAADLG